MPRPARCGPRPTGPQRHGPRGRRRFAPGGLARVRRERPFARLRQARRTQSASPSVKRGRRLRPPGDQPPRVRHAAWRPSARARPGVDQALRGAPRVARIRSAACSRARPRARGADPVVRPLQSRPRRPRPHRAVRCAPSPTSARSHRVREPATVSAAIPRQRAPPRRGRARVHSPNRARASDERADSASSAPRPAGPSVPRRRRRRRLAVDRAGASRRVPAGSPGGWLWCCAARGRAARARPHRGGA